MASHDDDTMPEETQGYKLSQPKQSLAEYQQMDAGDESLQRYKESLGLGGGTDISDPNDPRVCIILSLTMDSPGRPPRHHRSLYPRKRDHPQGQAFQHQGGCQVHHERQVQGPA
ncbi:rho GDP dissociation inhibitor [Fusarium oxysporum]|nr:rho GDP dissociation inhibitor [Fusarium oxysporum]